MPEARRFVYSVLLWLAASSPAAGLKALERINPPAFLKGNPGLYADFNFERHSQGTLVKLALGGKFSDIRIPKGASRPPRFQVVCEFTPKYKIAQEPQARGGVVDLARVLAEKKLAFNPGLFGKGSSQCFHAAVSLTLTPAEYLVTIMAEDPELGLKTEKTLHVTVPSTDSPAWQLGDLNFIMTAKQDSKGDWMLPNPFRQTGKKAMISSTRVAYQVVLPAEDWLGNTLVHQYVIARLNPSQKTVWEARQEKHPYPSQGLGQIPYEEVLDLPMKKIRAMKSGNYLLLVQVWPKSGKGGRMRALKSFDVEN